MSPSHSGLTQGSISKSKLIFIKTWQLAFLTSIEGETLKEFQFLGNNKDSLTCTT